MNNRDKKRRVKEQRRKTAAAVDPAGDGHQKTNGKRRCWVREFKEHIDISTCLVTQHRNERACRPCTWYGK